MSERGDVIVSEGGNAMRSRRPLGVTISAPGVLQSLPRMFVSGQMILISVLLGDTMGMRRAVVQFSGAVVVLVVGTVVVTGRHLESRNLP
jgi:hypothetical protein